MAKDRSSIGKLKNGLIAFGVLCASTVLPFNGVAADELAAVFQNKFDATIVRPLGILKQWGEVLIASESKKTALGAAVLNVQEKLHCVEKSVQQRNSEGRSREKNVITFDGDNDLRGSASVSNELDIIFGLSESDLKHVLSYHYVISASTDHPNLVVLAQQVNSIPRSCLLLAKKNKNTEIVASVVSGFLSLDLHLEKTASDANIEDLIKILKASLNGNGDLFDVKNVGSSVIRIENRKQIVIGGNVDILSDYLEDTPPEK
jgi:hypothetical protein